MLGTDARFARSFVETLDRHERHVLMLHYAEELSAAEIGMVLNIAEQKVGHMLDLLRDRARAAMSELAMV